MWKFKWWKGKDKWLFLLTIGVILCILAFPADQTVKKMSAASQKARGNNNTEKAEETKGGEAALPAGANVSDSYEAELELSLGDFL